MNRRETVRALNEFEARLGRLDRAIGRAEFALYTGGSSKGPVEWQLTRTRWLTEPSTLQLRASAEGIRGDDVWDRRVELLGRTIDDSMVEQHPPIVEARARLQRRVVAFRPRWHGKRVDRVVVEEALRRSHDRRERRRAYYADEPLNRGIETALRELVAARTDRARSLGFRSFPEFRLRLEGLSPARLETWIDQTMAAIRPSLRSFRRRFLESQGLGEWAPWDLRFAREQRDRLPDRAFPGRSMVADVLAALRQWGFPRDRLRFRVVRHDLPFGGLTIVPQVPDDVRVLVHPKGGWEYYMVLFHEFGHAVHSASIRQPTHLLRSADLGFAGYFEGLAGVFEELASEPSWLRTRRGLTADDVGKFKPAQQDSVLRAAGMATAVQFEQAMYARPEASLSELKARMVRETYGFARFDPPSFADGFFVTHPVYIQSYFLALLFERQVRHRLRRKLGQDLWPNPKVGPWLQAQFLQHGCRYDWVPRVHEVTGAPFGPRDFISFVNRPDP